MIRKLAAFAICVPLVACGASASGPSPTLVVFAAASLQPPFDRIAQQMHFTATFNYAGSQTLATQLTEGAQADVFASADTAHMTAIRNAGLLAEDPRLFAHNRLEIVVAKGNPKHILALSDLARAGLVVVLADSSVPAGRYAQQALARAGVKVEPASLELQVTAVLNKVALGEADAGIVYHSDVVSSGKVDGVTIPDSQNVIADYPIAALAGARDRAAADLFIADVLSPAGQQILEQSGFEPA